MHIKGEVKHKIFSILADSIDVLRLHEGATAMLNAEKEEAARLIEEADELKQENAKLKERCDVLERSFGDTAALEHAVTELQERNDRLRMRLDAINSKPGGNWKEMYDIARHTLGDVESDTNWLSVLDNRLGQLAEMHEADQERPVLDGVDAWWWRDIASEARRKLAETKAELEKYKTALRLCWRLVRRYRGEVGIGEAEDIFILGMREEGYDIETEEHRIEGFGSFGSEDNSKSQDEHDFL